MIFIDSSLELLTKRKRGQVSAKLWIRLTQLENSSPRNQSGSRSTRIKNLLKRSILKVEFHQVDTSCYCDYSNGRIDCGVTRFVLYITLYYVETKTNNILNIHTLYIICKSYLRYIYTTYSSYELSGHFLLHIRPYIKSSLVIEI